MWASAGIIALSGHLGLAAWLMREATIEPADAMPPPALMIELASLPEAVMTDADDIAPDQLSSVASTLAEPVEADEVIEADKPDYAETVEAEPVDTIAPEQVSEEDVRPIEETLSDLAIAEVPLPTSRPRPPKTSEKPAPPNEHKKPERQPRKRQQQAQAASPSATQARAQVTRSSRNAAREASSGAASSVAPAQWQARLMAHLEKRKRYPSSARARGERGVAYVRFTIDAQGNVLSASLARSSGYPELDAEVVALVRRASPVPQPPPNANRSITAPVRFSRD